MASIEGYQMFQRGNATARVTVPEIDATNLPGLHGESSGDGQATQHESEELTQQSSVNNSATKMSRTVSKDLWGLLRRLGGDHEEIELCHRIKDLKRDTYTIGRSSKCDITVADTWVSTNHCSIYCDYTQAKLRIFIEDSSANGTFINDALTRLRKGERMELKSGDQIFLLNPRKVETEGKKFATFTYINLRERLVAVREISFAPSRSLSVAQHVQLIQSPTRATGTGAAAGTSQASQHSSVSVLSSQNSQRYALHIEDKYIIGDQIGSGMSGQVYLCVNKVTHEHYAVKMIDTRKFSLTPGLSVSDLREEAILMKQFDHPNIIKVVDTFQTESMIYIVMELLRGGDLFDRIIEKERYGEESARQLMIQVLSAVEYLHERKIIHRDLKPENILLVSTKSDVQVKVTDFGLAKKANSVGLKTFCGTPQYFAPEVLKRKHNVQSNGRYGAAVDMWSLGVILYILLSGSFPFSDDEEILRADYSLNGMEWEGISPGAKHLIRSLMTLQVEHRYSVQQALKHPWICGIAYVPTKIQLGISSAFAAPTAPSGSNVATVRSPAGNAGEKSDGQSGSMEECKQEMCVDETSQSEAPRPNEGSKATTTTTASSTATSVSGKKRQVSTAAGASQQTGLTRKQSSMTSKKANLRRGGSVFAPLELKFKSSMEYVSSSSNLVALHTSLPAAIQDVISADSVFNMSCAATVTVSNASNTTSTVPAARLMEVVNIVPQKAAFTAFPTRPAQTPAPGSSPRFSESPEHFIDLESNTYSSTVVLSSTHVSIVHLSVTNDVSFMDNLRQPLRTANAVVPSPAPVPVSVPVLTRISESAMPGPSALKRSKSYDDTTTYNTHLNKFPESLLFPPRGGAVSGDKNVGTKICAFKTTTESIDPYDDAIEDYSSEEGENNVRNTRPDAQHKRPNKKTAATAVKAAKSSKVPVATAKGCMKKTKPVAAGPEGLSQTAQLSAQVDGLLSPANHHSNGAAMPAPVRRNRSVSFCEQLVVVDIAADHVATSCTAVPPVVNGIDEHAVLSSVSAPLPVPIAVSAQVTPVEGSAVKAVRSNTGKGGKVFTFDAVEGLNNCHISLNTTAAPLSEVTKVVTPVNLAGVSSSVALTSAAVPAGTTGVETASIVGAGGSSGGGASSKPTIGIKRTQSSLEQAWKLKSATTASTADSSNASRRSDENVRNGSTVEDEGAVQVGKKLRVPMKSLSELFRANSTTKH